MDRGALRIIGICMLGVCMLSLAPLAWNQELVWNRALLTNKWLGFCGDLIKIIAGFVLANVLWENKRMKDLQRGEEEHAQRLIRRQSRNMKECLNGLEKIEKAIMHGGQMELESGIDIISECRIKNIMAIEMGGDINDEVNDMEEHIMVWIRVGNAIDVLIKEHNKGEVKAYGEMKGNSKAAIESIRYSVSQL